MQGHLQKNFCDIYGWKKLSCRSLNYGKKLPWLPENVILNEQMNQKNI